MDAKLEADCEQAVKAQLILDAVADAESLGLTDDEITGEVVRRAQALGVAPAAYANQLVESGQLPMMAADLRRGKALAVVIGHAQVADTSGVPVDLSAFQEELASLTAA
jgi:trigger factor